MMRSNLKLQKNEHDNKTNIQSEKEGLQYCSINNAVQSQLHKQILFMEEKYQKIKKNLHQKKLMGDLNRHDVEEIGNIMNIIAMKYSQEKKNSVAQEWLRRAFKYCDLSERVRIVTYNNLACIYKQSNDLPMAFYYINKAQKQADYFCIEMQDDKLLKVVTDCSLNLCAILSAMGQHYKALRAARKALGILKSTQNLPGNYYKNLFPLLKYNEAVELQRLKMYEQAQFAYIQAQKSIGITEQLAQRVSKAIQEVRILKESNKNKNRISISRASKMSKRTKLSLPKFCSSPALQLSEATTLLKNYESVKTQKLIKNDKKQKNVLYEQLENKKQFRSIEPKANKDRKLFYQNYKMSNDINTKTMIRFRKSVLQSVQNFG